MSDILVVDDNDSLLDAISESVKTLSLAGVLLMRTIAEAKEAVLRQSFRRIIADQVFEGEDADGVTLLQEARAKDSKVELVLLTGKEVNPTRQQKMEEIRGVVVPKDRLSVELLKKLISQEPFREEEIGKREPQDVGQLSLQLDNTEKAYIELKKLTDLLIEDILMELGNVKNANVKSLLIGGRIFSAEELREELKLMTPLGRKIVKLHHELFRILREK